MKTSQIIAGAVAIVAFGGAYVLMKGSKPVQPVIVQTAPAPVRSDMEQVLVASKDIPLGSLVQEIDLAWSAWPRANVTDGLLTRSRNPKALEDIGGSVSRAPFVKGEPIRQSKLVKGPNAGFMSAILPAGSRAVAINIDASGATSAGGFILPNDRVDILRTTRANNNYTTTTILKNVRVLAIGQRIEEKNGERVVVGSNATLELTPKQAEQVVLAQRVGQLSLVLRSMFDANSELEPPSVREPPSPPLTIVRFGQTTTVSRR